MSWHWYYYRGEYRNLAKKPKGLRVRALYLYGLGSRARLAGYVVVGF